MAALGKFGLSSCSAGFVCLFAAVLAADAAGYVRPWTGLAASWEQLL